MASLFPDLFETPKIPGLSYRDDLLSRDEELRLIAGIDASALEPFRFQGWLGKRLTSSFGWRYDFDDARFGPTDPIPDWLLPARDRAAVFAGLEPASLAQALLIRYDPGAGIGWHRDRPVFDHVVGISLGVSAPLRFRRRKAEGFDRVTVPLAPRSIYHFRGEARYQWEHSIAEMEETRWSITFRTLSDTLTDRNMVR
ncbi:alpha-ketoglutarate-dependent dioxygenase AlkB [Sphingobium sp. AS12]|uniref:alpha-ketoglutarate-dependent dioxygenase AlkB n=1 Tax=Sphingobium sp. AS12 TaxID=2849495 RepID=UPI001C31AC33|nr:alpha-ketoglutarate-dependent dioxygenase AlkB [Sphingobium sp. AS12]MBV2148197.1 alpha-ketoglutarate-dependent dioxygenase AlkB [Sphingobium sp. AS12]